MPVWALVQLRDNKGDSFLLDIRKMKIAVVPTQEETECLNKFISTAKIEPVII